MATYPIPSDVKYNIVYGPNDTDYTGTYVASSQTITGTTGIQSYVTLLSGIVDGLKDDPRMDAVNDEFIYYGPEGNIPQFPAITVELSEGQEPWKTFPAGKDSQTVFTVRIYDEGYDYTTALQSVEEISKNVNHTLNARTGFSGLVYQADIVNKRFAMFDFDNMPVFGCEMEFLTKTRFSRAS